MAALTYDRDTKRLAGVGTDVDLIELPQKGNTILFSGALAMKETATGLVRPAAPGAGFELAGRVERQSDATGLADGAVNAVIRRGVFKYQADTALAPTVVDAPAYATDDQTVSAGSSAITLGANNGALVVTAKVPSLTAARVVVSGNNTALSSSIANGVLTINSATDNGGVATSTADQIIAELNTNQGTSVLAARATGSNGTGVTGAVAQASTTARASGKVHRIDSDGVYIRAGI